LRAAPSRLAAGAPARGSRKYFARGGSRRFFRFLIWRLLVHDLDVSLVLRDLRVAVRDGDDRLTAGSRATDLPARRGIRRGKLSPATGTNDADGHRESQKVLRRHH
jgi:hypothetical protein